MAFRGRGHAGSSSGRPSCSSSALSLFPLVASVALSLSKLTFRKGGIDLTWVGFSNYQSLLFGLERSHFLGVLKTPNPIGWAILIGASA